MFGKKKNQKKQRTSSKSAAPIRSNKQSSKVTPGADKKAPGKKSGEVKKPALKHSEAFENGTGGDKPIIIKGKGAAPKYKRSSRRELQRVARVGGYTVFDGPRTGKTFATPQEAKAYAVDVLVRTGEIVDVQKTDRQVTHTFKAPNTEVK